MIGIIGGTGLYQLEGLSDVKRLEIETPFGKPSAAIIVGNWNGNSVAFLPRHGSDHSLLPGEINFRANVWALKSIGVRKIISVSAVGSLDKSIEPGQLAIPNQYLDFTKGKRAHTFFGDGLVAHISTAEPSCKTLALAVSDTVKGLGSFIHTEKTYACVEGPRLGNRAESWFMKRNDCHLVGMTNVPEVYLARDAQICYCTVAVVTDYDCWLDDPSEHASVDKVFALYRKNIARVQDILGNIMKMDLPKDCTCRHSLSGAVMTPESALTPEKTSLLKLLRE